MGTTSRTRSREANAYLALQQTADALARGFAALFKTVDLSPTQYNVLRILRGAGPEGAACREIGERMITRDPDITRLLDRLDKRGLVRRVREEADRRVVRVTITHEGLDLLAELDGPVEALHHQQLGHLGEAKLKTFTDLLQQAREAVDGTGGE
jgi:DNA-binding MarR family transcriptional regulator